MKKALLLLFIWSFSINMGYTQPNKGHIIDSVSSLASIASPTNNMEVVCNCDSMVHCFNNGAWHTEYDSSHTIRMSKSAQVQANYTDTSNLNIDYIKNKPIGDYSNVSTTTSGSATFYLTSDKTSTGTALFTTINYVNPVVNDISANYVYSWAIVGKVLTITAKSAAPTGVIALLGISVLGAPTTVANGTTISVEVKGQ